MRIFLIIVGILVLLNVLLCISHVVVVLSFRGGKFDWSVRYLGIKILPRPKKDKAKKKPKKPKKEKKKSKKQEQAEADRKKDFLIDKLWRLMQDIAGKADLAGSVMFALGRPLLYLLRGITWYDIETDFVLGGTDAAETAQLYGKIQMVLQPLLGAAGSFMKVKRKKLSIVCDYTEDTSRFDCGCRFRLAVGRVIVMAIWLVFAFLADSCKAKKTLVTDRI
jgi:hypothetical protein